MSELEHTMRLTVNGGTFDFDDFPNGLTIEVTDYANKPNTVDEGGHPCYRYLIVSDGKGGTEEEVWRE